MSDPYLDGLDKPLLTGLEEALMTACLRLKMDHEHLRSHLAEVVQVFQEVTFGAVTGPVSNMDVVLTNFREGLEWVRDVERREILDRVVMVLRQCGLTQPQADLAETAIREAVVVWDLPKPGEDLEEEDDKT